MCAGAKVEAEIVRSKFHFAAKALAMTRVRSQFQVSKDSLWRVVLSTSTIADPESEESMDSASSDRASSQSGKTK